MAVVRQQVVQRGLLAHRMRIEPVGHDARQPQARVVALLHAKEGLEHVRDAVDAVFLQLDWTQNRIGRDERRTHA